jgi:hypothetical protein
MTMAHARSGQLIVVLLVIATATLAAAEASAQSPDIGIGGTGILSLQLTDESNVGATYLDEPIGGWGPGFGVFVTAIAGSGLTVSGEFTRSNYTAEQGLPPGSEPAHTLDQSLASGYLGYTIRDDSVMASFLGGVSWVFEELALSGFDTEHPLSPPLAFGGGVDVAIRMSGPLAIVTSAKYTYLLGRHETQGEIGMRSHVFRFGVGLRLRVK